VCVCVCVAHEMTVTPLGIDSRFEQIGEL